MSRYLCQVSLTLGARVQSSEFFLLLCGVVGLAAGEREILWHPG